MSKPDSHIAQSSSRRARQGRSAEALEKIADAVVTILAQEGQGGLTHRRVAKLAGVSLAATTYYHRGKFEMIADATQRLLDGYVRAFVRALTKYQAGTSVVSDLPALMTKLLTNAAGRHGRTTLAWCEIMLDCARTIEGHALARQWLNKMDVAWTGLVSAFGVPDPASIVAPAIDTTMGLLFLTLPLKLTADQILAVFVNEENPADAWAVTARGADGAAPAARSTAKSRETRDRIIAATTDLLIGGQPGGISYSAVAQRAGFATAALSYHFSSIERLVAEAQAQVFARSKDRYRDGLSSIPGPEAGLDPLADLTTATYIREVTEFRSLHLANYGIWVDAARKPELRPPVSAVIFDMIDAWTRQLAAVGAPKRPNYPVLALAHFIGKTIRALSTGATTAELATARPEFLTTFRGLAAGSSRLAHAA
ncbi:TetR/AcrR family transcriptional regulator [Caballeronia sordidicola]|uniref:Transcriptional regulator, TetR family n=1 Tax=Caballeronia sordidicola TaxID=196367 RepID=A0A242N6J3_CABSO|nr:TetR family transcriptional regulator [Caballeronia sordidicola]OTP79044.1 Transcriptional regulator, TetR family [Caballeronia sordidicola]